jgi:vacuolar-type H+-ATPase subunit E/Vma4
MIIVDNSKHLFNEIKKDKQNKIKELEKQYNLEIKEIKSNLDKDFNFQIQRIKKNQEIEFEQIKKQKESNFWLSENKKKLSLENQFIKDILQETKKKITSNKTIGNKIIKKMFNEVTKHNTKKIKTIIIPKGLKLRKEKYEDSLKNFKVSVLLDNNSCLELNLDDYLNNNITKIHQILKL